MITAREKTMKPVQQKQNPMPEGVLRRRIEIANRLIRKFEFSERPEKKQLLASLRKDIRRTEQAISH
jgi:hypothetical protein